MGWEIDTREIRWSRKLGSDLLVAAELLGGRVLWSPCKTRQPFHVLVGASARAELAVKSIEFQVAIHPTFPGCRLYCCLDNHDPLNYHSHQEAYSLHLLCGNFAWRTPRVCGVTRQC